MVAPLFIDKPKKLSSSHYIAPAATARSGSAETPTPAVERISYQGTKP